jgi:hypothetical protein
VGSPLIVVGISVQTFYPFALLFADDPKAMLSRELVLRHQQELHATWRDSRS